MTGCSAKGCKNRSENGIIFKSIPKTPFKRAAWVKNMNQSPPRNGRICGDHFPEDQWEIYGKALKKQAVPSIFDVTNSDSNSGVEEKESITSTESLNPVKQNIDNLNLQKKIQTLNKRLMMLKVNNKRLSHELYLQKCKNKELKRKLENVFTEDQIQAIRGKKFRKCSDETLAKSFKLKCVCGTNVYNLLRKMKFPFPAIRTLNLHCKIKKENQNSEKNEVVQQVP